jgi:hypothetical protein
MADILKKTYSGYVRGDYITCETKIYQVSQSIANNTTTYRAVVRLLCSNDASYHLDNDGVITIKVAGATSLYDTGLTGFDFRSYTSIEIFNDTATVNNDTDGSFSETFQTILKYPSSGSYADGTSSGTVTFTTIPRASVLSDISSFNIEDGVTISYTAYASFTEKLDIYLGATAIRTGYELASGSKVEFTDDEILNLYKLIPDLTATLSFQLKTYNESTQIGSTSTKTATGTIAGLLRKEIDSSVKRCVIYRQVSGSVKKCIPYIGIGGVGKRGIY